MKKFKIFAIVCACLLLFCGCASTGTADWEKTVDEIKTNTEYTRKIMATEMNGREDSDIFGEERNYFWYGIPIGSDLGYVDETLARQKGVQLMEGFYRYDINIAIDKNRFSAENNNMENDMVLQLRVIDEETGEAIADREIYRWDLAQSNVRQDIGVTFALAKTTTLTLEVKYLNKCTVTLAYLAITGIEKEEHIRPNFEAMFAETEADQKLQYDANKLYYFDLYDFMLTTGDSVFNYDVAFMISVLQGIVNRDGQHLFIRFNGRNAFSADMDNFWLDYLQGEGQLLEGKDVVEVESPAALLRIFKDAYNGYVLWDNDVPATSNVAATVCGVENRLPLRYMEEASLCSVLLKDGSEDVKVNLVDKFSGKTNKIWNTEIASTGSAKNDAYLWAKAKYMDTGKTCKNIIAYHLDAFTWDKSGLTTTYYNIQQQLLANKDYYIANQCFFMDLCVESAYAPNDDPTQKVGTDRATLEKILKTQNQLAKGELTTFGGFNPWWIKYSQESMPENGTNGVAIEWMLATLLGQYYMVKDADAYGFTSLANASIYCKSATQETLSQGIDRDEILKKAAEKYIDEDGNVLKKNYVMIYMGDYDAGAWTAMAMINNFRDPHLGTNALSWPVNPAGQSRIPMVTEYMYANKTENDYFVGDHNGYGYIDVMQIGAKAAEGVYGSKEDFLEVTKDSWAKYDLDIQALFIKTTPDEEIPMSDEWFTYMSDMAPYGVNAGNYVENLFGEVHYNSEGKPVSWGRSRDIPYTTPYACAEDLSKTMSKPRREPMFSTFRFILKSPTFIYETFERLTNPSSPYYSPSLEIEIVDPYTFYFLMGYNNGVR